MNSSYQESFDNETHPLPFGFAEIVTAAVLLIPLCAFGIVANILTITTVLYSRKLNSKSVWLSAVVSLGVVTSLGGKNGVTPKLSKSFINFRSPFFYLMLSLSVSDFLSALISPIALQRLTWGYEAWFWPDILCKLFWAIDIWTSYVTSIHIFYFSALRFMSVQWPFRFKSFTLFRAKIFIAIAWIVAFASGFFPTVLWYGGIERNRSLSVLQLPSCSLEVGNIRSLRSYREVAYPLFFYVPFFFILIFSIGVGIKIYLARKKRQKLKGSSIQAPNPKELRREIHRLAQLGLIVGSFLLGYIPRTAYHFFSVNRVDKLGHEPYPWWFAFVEYLLLRISECLNPVFYNLSSSTMRKETISTLKMIWFRIKPKKDEATAVTSVAAPISRTE